MRSISAQEFPPEVERVYRKARRLQWVTLAYIASSATFLYLTMGNSQAMRATFFEDAISAVPSLAYLICTAIARRDPTPDYPYGMHRATSIGHLVSALALTAMGLFLLAEGGYKLISGERASIGTVMLLGTEIWAGWPMLLALLYTAVPSIFLGRIKHNLAPELHDKILFADAGMMKADWMAESAAAVGVIGLGFGVWWLDPIGAALVSLDILKDGIGNLRVAVTDLIDRRPKKTDQSDWEPLPQQVHDLLLGLDWVADAEVRMREEGHIFLGEAFVVPVDTDGLIERLSKAADQARALDWRVHELVIMPVARLPDKNGRRRSEPVAPSEAPKSDR